MPREVFGPGALLNGAMYWGPRSNPFEKFVFSNAKIDTPKLPAVKSSVIFNVLGAIPATSAFIDSAGVTHGGLVWAIGLSSTGGGATLYAFDPGTLATLFTSPALARPGTKFSVPTVANSKVYVGTKGTVFAFAGTGTPRAVDMTSFPNVQLTLGPIVQGTGGAFSQTVTVTNNGTTPLFKTPLSLVCDELSPTRFFGSWAERFTYLAVFGLQQRDYLHTATLRRAGLPLRTDNRKRKNRRVRRCLVRNRKTDNGSERAPGPRRFEPPTKGL
jgi:hypothetical protein